MCPRLFPCGEGFIFGIAFIELIIDIINFIEINLVIIDFEVKWFIFILCLDIYFRASKSILNH